MPDPDWLKEISLRSASVPSPEQGWCCPACREHYIKQVAYTDVPLVLAMLQLVAEGLGIIMRNQEVCELVQSAIGNSDDAEAQAFVGDAELAEKALDAYCSGVLPKEE